MVVVLIPELFYDEIFDVQKKTRVPEASGYLVGFSETAPHVSHRTASFRRCRKHFPFFAFRQKSLSKMSQNRVPADPSFIRKTRFCAVSN